MSTMYYIYLLTFLGYPFIGFQISRFLNVDFFKKGFKILFLLFVVHNLLFSFGCSIKGDYPDYVIFSIEYLFTCISISMLYKIKINKTGLLKVLGTVLIGIGFIQGLIGILLFIVIVQDFEADKIYKFKHNDILYQTRRYRSGFVTQMDTKYRFETYKNFDLLPIEIKIDDTKLFDTKCKVKFEDKQFKIDIIEVGNKKELKLFSPDGQSYYKTIN